MSIAKAKEISVFVDESGSFEPDEVSSRFYLICFVMHDQSADIMPYVSSLESELEARSLGAKHCVHAGPEFVPNVYPESYRLFQAADFICSVELVAAKVAEGNMSVSESRFFGDRREFLRNTLKPIRRKSV